MFMEKTKRVNNGWGWKICRDTDQKRPLQTNCTLQAAAVVFNMEGPWDFT